VCGDSYSDEHYNWLNPFGCPGLLSYKYSKFNIACKRFWIAFGIILLYILASPIILFLIVPILVPFYIIIEVTTGSKCDDWDKVGLCLCILIAFTILFALSIPIFIMVILPKFIIKIIRENRRYKKIVELRL
jgi:hypothetical protein